MYIFKQLVPALWAIIPGALLLVLTVVVGITFKTRAGARHAMKEAKDKLKETEQAFEAFKASSGAQISELKKKIDGMSSRTYLTDFEGGNIYQLLSQKMVELSGESLSHGLVKDENGEILPFLTRLKMDSIQINDQFGALRGHLVKLEGGDDEAQEKTRIDPFAKRPPNLQQEPAPLHEPADDDGDETVFLEHPIESPEDSASGLPYVRIVAGKNKGSTHHLNYTKATIGRDRSNHILLSDDGFASGFHCEILFENHNFVIKDNNSRNSTFHNGKKITRASLSFGDNVKAGDTEMVFSCKGFDIKDNDPDGAITEFKKCISRKPDFIEALENLAFLLERNIARRREAQPIWDRITALRTVK